MSTEPLHRLTTEQEAKRIMDEQEQNTRMEDLLEVILWDWVGYGGFSFILFCMCNRAHFVPIH